METKNYPNSNQESAKTVAFIDAQNVWQGVTKQGWKLDWKLFREYLISKYNVSIAYMFIGFVQENQALYDNLKKAGYELMFKPTSRFNGKIKGNVDANIVYHAMKHYNEYGKGLLVAADGDYYQMVDDLYQAQKLQAVISPNLRHESAYLLKQASRERLFCLNEIKHLVSR